MLLKWLSKWILRLLLLTYFTLPTMAQAGCVSQVQDFLAQFKIRPFVLMQWGEVHTNHHTNTFSIIEDLQIEIRHESQIPLIAKAIYPKGLKRRKLVAHRLTKAFRQGHKRISIRLIAPRVVNDLTNTVPTCSGYNCMNATLKWFYADVPLEETHPIKFQNYLKTHFRPIKVGEVMQFGDIVVWKDVDGEVIHSAVFLNEKWIWHKATYSSSTSWRFEQLMHVNMMYGEDSKAGGVMKAYRHKPRW